MTPTQTLTGAEQVRWDVSELFLGVKDPAVLQTMNDAKQKAIHFVKKYKGQLAQLSASQLADAILEMEALLTPVYKVNQFVNLIYATDMLNDEIKALVSKIDEEESELSNLILFFHLELGALPQEKGQALLQDSALMPYTYSVQRTLETAKYNLSEKEEQLCNLKDLTGIQALQRIYNELTSSFTFEFTLEGETKTMNGSELRALRSHVDPKVRREAMQLFLSRYEEHQLVISHTFNNIVKSHAIENQLRGYPSAISARNIGHDLEDKTVDVLHEVTQESYPLVQRYYTLKAQLLNLHDLSLADIYAPLPQANKKYTWNEAKEIVLEGFKAFDSDIYQMALSMFNENRIDAPVTPTKRGGAFCSSSTPDLKPYVLVNFLGKQRDVSTLAHELGHAIHDMLCDKQPLSYYHPILPLAETASVFSEMIVTDYLLKQETDKTSKMALLTDKLEDIFATSHRQNMFSCFEKATHAAIKDKVLSASELCELYQEQLQKMFGTAVVQPEIYKWEWAAIPHIFEWPFYVYAYNFGNLLVMALYQQYKTQGQAFIPKYKALLAAGSSMPPNEMAALVGVSFSDPNFWKQSLKYIETLIDQLEGLMNER